MLNTATHSDESTWHRGSEISALHSTVDSAAAAPEALKNAADSAAVAPASPCVRSIEMKVARTQEELESCFCLLHDAYVDSGYMQPHISGMRVSIYNALPTTTTIMARYQGVTIGTLTLIRQNAIGLPAERLFDLSEIRATGGACAELSAFAIAPEFRREGPKILLPLMKHVFHHAHHVFGIRHLIIAVNPTHFQLYRSLGFMPMQSGVVESYDFVNGAPAIGGHLDMVKALARASTKQSSRAPRKRNLRQYFLERSTVVDHGAETMHGGHRDRSIEHHATMNERVFRYFFTERTSILREAGERESNVLRSIYGAVAA